LGKSFYNILLGIFIPIIPMVICFLAFGCCSRFPFIKCHPNEKITIVWKADSDSNNERSVQMALMALTEEGEFNTLPIKTFFSKEWKDNLPKTCKFEIKFVSPNQIDTLVWDFKESMKECKPQYLGFVVRFASTERGADRAILSIGEKGFPIQVNLEIHKNSLEANF
jgi:predicted component of type VI protein secretion system